MIISESQEWVNRPLDVVFNALLDLEGYSRWITGETTLRFLTPPPAAPGTLFLMTVNGTPYSCEVTHVQPLALFSFIGSDGPAMSGGTQFRLLFTLSPENAGTRVSIYSELTTGAFGLFDSLALNANLQQTRESLRRFAAMLNAPA